MTIKTKQDDDAQQRREEALSDDGDWLYGFNCAGAIVKHVRMPPSGRMQHMSSKFWENLRTRGIIAKKENKDLIVFAEDLPPRYKVVLERGHPKDVWVGAIDQGLTEIAKEHGFIILSASYEDQTYLMRYVGSID